MATPAAILSIMIEANTSKAALQLRGMQKQLEATGATVTKVEEKTKSASKHISAVGDSAQKSGTSLAGFAKAAAAAVVAFEGFRLARDAISDVEDLGKATTKLQAVTGADATTASKWIELMKLRGVNAKATSMTFITLERNMRNAELGSKTAKTAFSQLGISEEEMKRTSPVEMIGLIADGLHRIHDPAVRAAIAQQEFGRGAQALIGVLSGGSKSLEENLGMIQKFGAYLPKNTSAIKKAVEINHEWELAQEGLKIQFTTAVLPTLVKVGSAVMGFVVQMRTGVGVGGLLGKALSKLAGYIKTTFNWVRQMVEQFKQGKPLAVALGAAVIAVATAVGVLTTALKVATVAQAIFDAVAEANPYMLVVTAIIALVAALVVLYLKVRVVRQFIQNAWHAIKKVAMDVWPTVRKIIVGTWNVIRNVAQAVWPVIKAIVVGVFNAIKTAVRIAVAVFRVQFAILKTIADVAFNYVKTLWDVVLHPVFNAIMWVIKNALIPAFNAIKGPVATVAQAIGDAFGTMKTIVVGVIDFVLGAFSSLLRVFEKIVHLGTKIPIIGGLFKGLDKDIAGVADSIDSLRTALSGGRSRPTSPYTETGTHPTGGPAGVGMSPSGGGTETGTHPTHTGFGGVTTHGAGPTEVARRHGPAIHRTARHVARAGGAIPSSSGGAGDGATGGGSGAGGGGTPSPATHIRRTAAHRRRAHRAAQTVDTSSFDLAPTGANVMLPTLVDVTRAIRRGGPAVVHHHHNNNHVEIKVEKAGDEHKVGQVLDRITGTKIHARMRAAGMRGT